MDFKMRSNLLLIIVCCVNLVVPRALNEPECHAELEVIVVADGSASVSDLDFEELKTAVAALVRDLNVDYVGTKFGFILYSTHVTETDTINLSGDSTDIINAIQGLKHPRGTTNTAEGISRLSIMVQTDGRENVPVVGIVITDGQSNNFHATVTAATNAKEIYNVNMFAVGVSNFVNYQELKAIASKDEQVLNIENFSSLSAILRDIANDVCIASTTMTSEVTTTLDLTSSTPVPTKTTPEPTTTTPKPTTTTSDPTTTTTEPTTTTTAEPTTTTQEPTTTTPDPTTTTPEPTTITSDPTTTTPDPTTTTSEPTTTTPDPTTTTPDPTTTTSEPTTTTLDSTTTTPDPKTTTSEPIKTTLDPTTTTLDSTTTTPDPTTTTPDPTTTTPDPSTTISKPTTTTPETTTATPDPTTPTQEPTTTTPDLTTTTPDPTTTTPEPTMTTPDPTTTSPDPIITTPDPTTTTPDPTTTTSKPTTTTPDPTMTTLDHTTTTLDSTTTTPDPTTTTSDPTTTTPEPTTTTPEPTKTTPDPTTTTPDPTATTLEPTTTTPESTTSTLGPTITTLQPTTMIPITTTKPPKCNNSELEVVIVADGSVSISDESFETLKSSVISLVNEIKLSNVGTKFGFILYSNHVEETINLNADTEFIKTKIENLVHTKGSTNTASGITRLSIMMGDYGRDNVPRVGIVVTDGASNDYHATLTAAQNAKEIEEVNMFAVGIGALINFDELLGIASQPDQVLNINDFSRLADILSDIAEDVCTS